MGEDTKRRVEAWEVGTKPLLMARRWCEMAAPLVGAGERETLTEAKAVEVLMSQCAKDSNANIQPRSTLENVWVRVDDTFYKDAGKDRFHHRRWDWDIQAAGEDKRSVRRWAYCENGDWADGDPELPTPLLLRGSQQDKVVPEDDVMHDIAPRGYWPGETAVFPWAETKMTQGVMSRYIGGHARFEERDGPNEEERKGLRRAEEDEAKRQAKRTTIQTKIDRPGAEAERRRGQAGKPVCG